MKKTVWAVIPLLFALAAPRSAGALTTIEPGVDGIGAISGGVIELGIDNMLLVRFDSTGEDATARSTLEATYVGGITPRFFLLDNFSLAANLQVFYGKRTETTTDPLTLAETEASYSDVGFLGVLMANYYLRLGYGMFFAPGLGAGGFYGVRGIPEWDTSVPPRRITRDSTLYGGAVKLDLGFVFYAGPHFNLKGGPDLLCRFGKIQSDLAGAEAESLFSIEAAFHLGLAYSL